MNDRGALVPVLLSLPTIYGCQLSSPPAVSDQTPPIAEIHNGDQAESCQWPSTALLVGPGNDLLCSSTLIHPRFLLTAAHCITPDRPVIEARFGEDGQLLPERTVGVVECTSNPMYYEELSVDMALCELATPVEDIQRFPIAQGCELDGLSPGEVVQIVGYGQTQAWWIYGTENVYGEGAGSKRFTSQSIYQVRNDSEEMDLVGVDEFSSACYGDSGGGAFVQLDDGTWRLVGIAQSIFFPPDSEPFPDPTTGGSDTAPDTNVGEEYEVCGYGSTYSMIASQMAWIEEVVGSDVSPCFTASGDWDPGPDCTPFPTQLGESVGVWATGCAGELGGVPQCGPPGPAPAACVERGWQTSHEAWQNAVNDGGGAYYYVARTYSLAGETTIGCTYDTTIRVRDGVVTERSFSVAGFPGIHCEEPFVEVGDEVGESDVPYAVAPVGLEQVYLDCCYNHLNVSEEEYTTYFGVDDAGLLETCGARYLGCGELCVRDEPGDIRIVEHGFGT